MMITRFPSSLSNSFLHVAAALLSQRRAQEVDVRLVGVTARHLPEVSQSPQ